MRIANIDVIAIRAPRKEVVRSAGVNTVSASDFGIVRVEADNGCEGLGEISITYPQIGHALCHAARRLIVPRLLGLDPLALPVAMRAVDGALGGELSAPYLRAAFEMALLDLAGRHYGVPVFQLLGGRARESVPSTVGPYKVLGLLGEGAMGRVFRAERESRTVALKLLRREHLRSQLLLDRFFREARAVSRICHPNIVEVIEVGEERGAEGLERAYCAMELLEGKTLGALFRERSLDVTRTVRIAVQVCDALEAAHTTGGVHRDVKPDNLFVCSRQGADWVKLLDFGIAKLLRVGPELSRTPATVIGTPHYMAPEQASGAPVDGRTDLYALGVVLYELLAGRRPGRVRGAPEPLPAQTPGGEPIAPALVRPVLQCLAADPANRPASAAVLRAALGAAVPGVTSGTAPRAPALRPGRKAS